MNIGISLNIDVTKIDKNRLVPGKKGQKYLDLTCFLNDKEPGKYGDHGMITHSKTQEERENKIKTPICGNSKIFWIGDSSTEENKGYQEDTLDFDSDLNDDLAF